MSSEDTNPEVAESQLQIVLVGESGAGKSTLINKIFGHENAQTGVGAAQTMAFHRYPPTAEQPDIALWDSRGFELRKENLELEFQQWVDAKTQVPVTSPDRLHVAWYVVPVTRARWTRADSEFVKGVLQSVATVIVLHKVDRAPPDVTQRMRETIEAEELPNVRAVVNVCSVAPPAPQKCECGSDNIVVMQREHKWKCQACERHGTSNCYGHDELLRCTRKFAREGGLINSVTHALEENAALRMERIGHGEYGNLEDNEKVGKILCCFRDDHSLCWWFWCCCLCLCFK